MQQYPEYAVTLDTPMGVFSLLVAQGDEVVASGFSDAKRLLDRLGWNLKTPPAVSSHPLYEDCIRRYFKGDFTALDKIARSQHGGAFQQKVWNVLNTIPAGFTLTYKQLAAATGSNAVRAAGTACGHNHLVLLVPCHRVVRSDGTTGQYVYGRLIKQQLLSLEESHLVQATTPQ